MGNMFPRSPSFQAKATLVCPNDPSHAFPPRQAFATGIIGADVYCFNGGFVGGPYDDRMGKFSEGGRQWEVIPASGDPPPSPRAACSNAVIGSNLYVFGGWDADTKDHLNDLSCFNSETCTWNVIYNASTAVPSPCPRRGASLLPLSATELVLFGGSVGSMKNLLSDIWIFDLTTQCWREVKQAEGSTPLCRFRHVAWIVEQKLWVFGGVSGRALSNHLCCFDFRAGTWETLPPLGDKVPDPREASTCATFVFNAKTYLCIFGGSGPLGNLDDLWLLDIADPQRWDRSDA